MQGTKSATKRFRNKVENQLRIPSMAKSLLGSNHFRIHFKGTVLIVYTHETCSLWFFMHPLQTLYLIIFLSQ